jgi:tetratricopeptide (TPR) repeat protein
MAASRKGFLAGGRHKEALSDINNALHTLTTMASMETAGRCESEAEQPLPGNRRLQPRRIAEVHSSVALLRTSLRVCSLARMTQALADYSIAITMRPDDPETRLSRGRVLVYLKRYRDAIEDYDQAIKLRPIFDEAYFARGQGHFLMGDFQASVTDLETGLRLKPGEPDAEQLLSKAREALAPPRPPVAATPEKPATPIPAVLPPALTAEAAQKPPQPVPVVSPRPPVVAPAAAAPAYAVQVGAFADRKRAEQLRARMENRCGSAAIVEKPGRPPLWRVLAGRESSRAKATALAQSLRTEFPATLVVLLANEGNAIRSDPGLRSAGFLHLEDGERPGVGHFQFMPVLVFGPHHYVQARTGRQ